MSSQIVHSGIAELTEEQLVEQVAGEFLKYILTRVEH